MTSLKAKCISHCLLSELHIWYSWTILRLNHGIFLLSCDAKSNRLVCFSWNLNQFLVGKQDALAEIRLSQGLLIFFAHLFNPSQNECLNNQKWSVQFQALRNGIFKRYGMVFPKHFQILMKNIINVLIKIYEFMIWYIHKLIWNTFITVIGFLSTIYQIYEIFNCIALLQNDHEMSYVIPLKNWYFMSLMKLIRHQTVVKVTPNILLFH